MTLQELIQRATRSRYRRALEAEVARLRAENRALLNSILGIAGVPPIFVAENDVSPVGGLQAAVGTVVPRLKAGGVNTSANSTGAAVRSKRLAPRSLGLPASPNDKTVTPMRRRSWHQIFRMLEINSARKKAASEIL
jgi:hypothetical protein